MALAELLRQRPTGFAVYVLGVAALGSLVLGFGVAVHLPAALGTVDGTFVLLACLMVAAELRPLSVQRRGGAKDSISLSGAFACALLLHYDWSLVAATLALGSLLDDRRNGLAWWKSAFNVGQYTL